MDSSFSSWLATSILYKTPIYLCYITNYIIRLVPFKVSSPQYASISFFANSILPPLSKVICFDNFPANHFLIDLSQVDVVQNTFSVPLCQPSSLFSIVMKGENGIDSRHLISWDIREPVTKQRRLLESFPPIDILRGYHIIGKKGLQLLFVLAEEGDWSFFFQIVFNFAD